MTDTSGQPVDFDRLLTGKRPNEIKVTIVLDPVVADEHRSARDRFNTAELAAVARPDSDEAAEALVTARQVFESATDALRDAAVTFTFRSLSRRRWDQLVEDHPASQQQKAKAKAAGVDPKKLVFDPDRFPPAAIAASCVDPAMTVEQAQQLWESDGWTAADLNALFDAAVFVNTQSRVVDLGKG